ncbi:MAG: hypothetical protein WCD70_03850 [Alphaproteobacteria bacterium]
MSDLIPLFADHSHPLVNQIINETALRCPDCGAHQTSLVLMIEACAFKPRYAVVCTKCKRRGSLGKHPKEAVRQWNKRPGFFASLFKKRRQQ